MEISNTKPEHFKIEIQCHRAKELQQTSLTTDRLVINIGEPKLVEIKRRGVWERKTYDTGNFSIVPYGHENIVRWFDSIKFVVIQIEPSFIHEFLQLKNLSLGEYRGISDKLVYDIASSFKREMDQVQLPSKIYIQSLAIDIAIHLGTQYETSGRSVYAPKGKFSSVQLNQVLEYCHAFLSNDLGVDDMAALIHLSPFHFARLFKNTLGIAPRQYVLRLKVDRAKQLIKKNEHSLSSIAYDLGFADQAHFSNTFRKFTGISPSQFMQA
ncbi:AraC family transcriptional regulator [Flavitalea sp. BT771]|uniref:helix-turn-helix domain-containing protein n=1 Tax=Flavitalea sp. BT771 TaxID=3063329 RepID=UPI0026E193BD|nr:AraC family transcriptional regulator [Flavitalea sp. BT771]MDO6432659.1 AraC family transcriptional regulator [Flavitalea sp. BT771]MDV6222065.1 AraC family transcriptional regulator [Flavitalea sp. BT771]